MSILNKYIACLTMALSIFACTPGTKESGQPQGEGQDSLTVSTELKGRRAGKVVKVCDGDTYEILLEGEQQPRRVRMYAIDAPESGQDFSRKSRHYLDSLIWKKQVTVDILDIDSYDRLLVYTYLPDGREVSHEMVRAGYAWHYTHYDSDPTMDSLQLSARNAGVGLWVDKCPVEPWIEKAMRKKGYKSLEIKKMKMDGEIDDLRMVRRIPKRSE